MPSHHDALLIVAFGGPEGRDDVLPFLEQVMRGRELPPERLRTVLSHYQHFGGRSPINDECRALVAAARGELDEAGLALPIYWGNRNWHPFLVDTLRRMARDGVRRALAFVTAPFGSYPSCRQYREDLARAQAAIGEEAPVVDKLRGFHNHPGHVEALVSCVRAAFDRLPEARRAAARLVFTTHSIPRAMAAVSPYEAQARETADLVASALGRTDWSLAYQSRSGPPEQPWLEPDIRDLLRALAEQGVKEVVVAPIGFVCDHMEVVYDLDLEAKGRAVDLGLEMMRAATVGRHPRFVRMIRELVKERLSDSPVRPFLGTSGAAPDTCPNECCRPVRPEGP